MTDFVLTEYSLEEAKRLILHHRPGADVETQLECMDGLRDILERNGISFDDLRGWVRGAHGDVSWMIYRARRDGWWPDDRFIEDICNAPGDRDTAIRLARKNGLWPKNEGN